MYENASNRIGGKTLPGSGNRYQKGDARNGVVRIEAKCTTKESFRVTLDMIRKIEDAALPCGELPVLAIEFLSETGEVKRRVCVVPDYVLDSL